MDNKNPDAHPPRDEAEAGHNSADELFSNSLDVSCLQCRQLFSVIEADQQLHCPHCGASQIPLARPAAGQIQTTDPQRNPTPPAGPVVGADRVTPSIPADYVVGSHTQSVSESTEPARAAEAPLADTAFYREIALSSEPVLPGRPASVPGTGSPERPGPAEDETNLELNTDPPAPGAVGARPYAPRTGHSPTAPTEFERPASGSSMPDADTEGTRLVGEVAGPIGRSGTGSEKPRPKHYFPPKNRSAENEDKARESTTDSEYDAGQAIKAGAQQDESTRADRSPVAPVAHWIQRLTAGEGHGDKPCRIGLPADEDEHQQTFGGTIFLVLFSPLHAFYRMHRQGGFAEPLKFTIECVLGATIASYGLFCVIKLFQVGIEHWGGKSLDLLAALGLTLATQLAVLMLLGLAVAGVTSIFVFAFSGFFHLTLKLLGGARYNYETTFRTVAYSTGATSIIGVVPIVGTVVGPVANLIIMVLGIYASHETTLAKASAAVLIPCVLAGLLITGFMFLLWMVAFVI